MRADDRALADLAGSVADGKPVDWQATEARADVRDRRLIRHLRLVESIASLYRSIPSDDAAEVPSAAPAAEPTGPRWGRLVMLERIGHGTSGDVFRAWDTELHREVALKLLRDDGRGTPAAGGEAQLGDLATGRGSRSDTHERVLQEARRLARVRHPHVVQVYGAEQHDGCVGLWMELVRGESLEQIVAARGAFGAREAALVGQDLCAALAAVHGAGLLHRDVKAQNVLRESGGRTVLMDFGTGEELRQEAGTTRMAGTPLYLAPEIFKGQAASVQSDLYSLGVLLFYLASGQFPVTAGSIEQLARAHAHQQKRRLRDLRPDLPASFVHVVERALEHEPGQRYRTAGEMEAALRESVDRFQAPFVKLVSGWRAFTRRSALAAWIAAGLVLVTAVGAIVWSGAGKNAPAAPALAMSGVAVLPLVDVSGSNELPYLADALTDQLIATLGQIRALRVTSRTSVMQFKNSTRPIAEIGKGLGVQSVVEGTVLVIAGDPRRAVVNVRLIAAGTDTILLSRSFERQLGDLLALQSEIARSIADAVNAALSPDESERLRQPHSTNAAAQEAYMLGRYHFGRYGLQEEQLALKAFQRAIQLDPGHAAAHAAAAQCYFTLGFSGQMSQPEARALALAEINRALELDDMVEEAHAAAADLKFYYDWDWAGADREYLRALDLNPSSTYTRSQYARFLAAAGRLDEAVEQATIATRLDPAAAASAHTRGLIFFYKRDYPSAEQALLEALQRDSGYVRARATLGRVFEGRGDVPRAIAATEQALAQAEGAGVPWRVQRVRLQAVAGEHERARTQFADLLRQLDQQKLRISFEDLAYFRIALGEHDAGLALLERAVDEHTPGVLWLAVDPRVDPVRKDPRFEALLRRIGVPQPAARLP